LQKSFDFSQTYKNTLARRSANETTAKQRNRFLQTLKKILYLLYFIQFFMSRAQKSWLWQRNFGFALFSATKTDRLYCL